MPPLPHWGEPPWRVHIGLECAAPPPRCEVAVVGGGFTGLAAAYTLSSHGANVALFEAQRLGSGASGRTGGVVLEDSAAGALPDTGDCIPALQRILNKAEIECDLELPASRSDISRLLSPAHRKKVQAVDPVLEGHRASSKIVFGKTQS
jgi:glycine/D-amino acid oxidase-like deaminating enzyme